MICAGCRSVEHCLCHGCAFDAPVTPFPCDRQQAPTDAERNAQSAGAAPSAAEAAPVSPALEVAA